MNRDKKTSPDAPMIKIEKQLERIRRQILQSDKRLKRQLKCIELAIERISMGASLAEVAKRHNLSERNVRRCIDNAILMARSRMFEKPTGT